jgi:phospholipid transport system transporter-binding protein
MSATYQLPHQISHENAEEVLAAGARSLQELSTGSVWAINCQSLQSFDSSALSVILSLKRRAAKASVTVELMAVPEKLASLARVYDLADIVLS